MAGGWRSRNRDVYHAGHAVDYGVMRSSEGPIANLSSAGEMITETAIITDCMTLPLPAGSWARQAPSAPHPHEFGCIHGPEVACWDECGSMWGGADVYLLRAARILLIVLQIKEVAEGNLSEGG